MVQVSTPSSIWQNLSSFSFFCSGYFSDLLLIRLLLSLAYIWLLIVGLLGHPSWSDLSRKPRTIAVDTIAWAVLNLYTHGSAFLGLVHDERYVELTEDQAALWRMFYRHSGLSQMLFQKLLAPRLKVVELHEGDEIPTLDFFYIILEGVVRVDLSMNEKEGRLWLCSGSIFPIRHMGFNYIPRCTMFHKQRLSAVCDTKVRLFRFTDSDLAELSRNNLAKDAWHALLISVLSEIVERPWKDNETPNPARGEIFAELQDWEQPKATFAGSGGALRFPFSHLWETAKSSFSVPWPIKPWPVGLRHGKLPAPPARQTATS